METDRALEALIASPKYRGVYRGAVERVYREMLRRHKPKEAEKAARAELHRITGAFLTPGDLKKARALLEEAVSGDGDALTRVLSLHASTRERLDTMAELYDRALPALGSPKTVLDLACGLNPLYLGSLGLTVRGIELQTDAANLVNHWAEALHWDVRVTPGDLAENVPLPEAMSRDGRMSADCLSECDPFPKAAGQAAHMVSADLAENVPLPEAMGRNVRVTPGDLAENVPLPEAMGRNVRMAPGYPAEDVPLPEADATLLMKLLPLLDKQMPGGGAALLERLRSKRALVTFPTRTLSGRNVGMKEHYETSFEKNLPFARIVDKFTVPGELCYILEMDRR